MKKEVLKKIEEDWDEYMYCHSCNWASSFHECEDDISKALEWAIKEKVDYIEVPCHGESDDLESHRGLYLDVKKYIK